MSRNRTLPGKGDLRVPRPELQHIILHKTFTLQREEGIDLIPQRFEIFGERSAQAELTESHLGQSDRFELRFDLFAHLCDGVSSDLKNGSLHR